MRSGGRRERGSIRERRPGVWEVTVNLGIEVDAEGRKRRRRKTVTVDGTERQAEKMLRKHLGQLDEGRFVEPDKITFAEWLLVWFETAIKGKRKRRTEETYENVIQRHLIPSNLGAIPLQKLISTDIERYFTEKLAGTLPDRDRKLQKLSPGTLQQHATVIHSALGSAQKKNLVHRNEAKLVDGKPRREDKSDDVERNCWESHEAKRFLEVACEFGPLQSAFYTLALETGVRKGEIVGLRWKDVNFDRCTVRVAQQLLRPGREPVFGTPKSKSAKRTIDITPETAQLLSAHRKHQLEVKMANRHEYRDFGLVFAKPNGVPLSVNNIGQREFADLIEKANVKRITFHGLRHTSATLSLQAGTLPHVVSQRLGHKRIEITLNLYAHALPSMGRDAAAKLSSLLR